MTYQSWLHQVTQEYNKAQGTSYNKEQLEAAAGAHLYKQWERGHDAETAATILHEQGSHLLP